MSSHNEKYNNNSNNSNSNELQEEIKWEVIKPGRKEQKDEGGENQEQKVKMKLNKLHNGKNTKILS